MMVCAVSTSYLFFALDKYFVIFIDYCHQMTPSGPGRHLSWWRQVACCFGQLLVFDQRYNVSPSEHGTGRPRVLWRQQRSSTCANIRKTASFWTGRSLIWGYSASLLAVTGLAAVAFPEDFQHCILFWGVAATTEWWRGVSDLVLKLVYKLAYLQWTEICLPCENEIKTMPK